MLFRSQMLVAWHQFSDKEARSPLYPYALWVLTTLYSQSNQLLASEKNPDADVLRTFGTEIAAALIADPVAPTVLKGLAIFSHESMLEDSPLPYRFAEFIRPKKKYTLPPLPPPPPPVPAPPQTKALAAPPATPSKP